MSLKRTAREIVGKFRRVDFGDVDRHDDFFITGCCRTLFDKKSGCELQQ
jgi:hypothetical protein